MQITKEMVEQRILLLKTEREHAVAAVGSYNGAIAQAEWELSTLAQEPPLAEAPVKLKRQPAKCKGRGCNKRPPVLPSETPVAPAQEEPIAEEYVNG